MESPPFQMCPRYEAAVDLLGKRWTGLLLRVLLEGPRRFCELTDALDGLSDRMLSARLKELEAAGVVAREVEPGPPVRVCYRLTPKGEDLGQVVDAIGVWAERWIRPPDERRPRARQGVGKARASRG